MVGLKANGFFGNFSFSNITGDTVGAHVVVIGFVFTLIHTHGAELDGQGAIAKVTCITIIFAF